MRIRRIAIGVAATLAAACVLYVTVLPLTLILTTDTDAMRVRLLYETDRQALLDACRELSRRVAAKELKPGQYCMQSDPKPETLTFPQIIRDLKPVTVTIDENGEIRVAMIGGLDHIGVRAYPPGYRSGAAVTLGDRELVEGLWYYDDGYDARPDDWDKHIEQLRPKGSQR